MKAAWHAVLAVLVGLAPAIAFNHAEFKTCVDSAFCTRLRGHVSNAKHSVLPASVAVTDSGLSATIINDSNQAHFPLNITSYHGVLRLQIDEAGADRSRVSDVLSPDLKPVPEKTTCSEVSCTLQLGAARVELSLKPFNIVVSVSGKEVMAFNSRNMFSIEHKRERTPDDPQGWWEESFKSHKDTKPKGPQGISFDISFPGFDHVYGLPERATTLALRPTIGTNIVSEPYRLYNLDVFEYLDDSPFGLYGSIPLLMAHNAEHTIGVFWLNAAEMFVDIERPSDGQTQTQWFAEAGILDVFLLLGPSPMNVTTQFAALTGTTAMPQMFSIGYHQCRWNYKDEADVSAVNNGFDDHAMPCDVIWLDIEHTDGKRYMTWDKNVFPTPERMQNELAAVGRKTVTIVDPHVKRDDQFAMHAEATSKGYYVKDRTGKVFEGWCWPGSSSYLDVVNPEIRSWWADQFSLAKYKGSTDNLYIWNDMNEPSVFNGPEVTMHKDAIHFGGVEHRDVHNLYGYFYHMATADGLRRRGYTKDPSFGDRPFVLSRAFFAGTQRVGPIWTGDNGASWNQLRVSLPMLLTLNIGGLPNTGADIGGFFGNPGAQLMLRWYQAAIFSPFCRGHAHLDTARREPWLFGEEPTTLIRAALRERYALLPYLYTQFRAANVTGTPIMRPMWYEYPSHTDLFSEQRQFMFGPALLVAPVLDEDATHVDVTLPTTDRWFDAATGTEMHERDGTQQYPVTLVSIPRFYRGGHVVTRRERPRRNTAAQERDPYTIIVTLDKQGNAKGQLYIDDGRSFAFLEGHYLEAEISFQNGEMSYALKHRGLELRDAVERIVIIGAKFDRTVEGTEVKSERCLDVSRGPVSLGVPAEEALIIRQPEVTVSSDWTIKFTGLQS